MPTIRYEDTANTDTDIVASYFEPGCTGSRVFIPKSGAFGTYIEWDNIVSPTAQTALFEFFVLADGNGPTIGIELNGIVETPLSVVNTSGTGCALYSVSLPVLAGNNVLRVTSAGNTSNMKLDYVDVTTNDTVYGGDAVDDALGILIVSVANSGDVSTNDTPCDSPYVTTYALIVGSSVNCTVIVNSDGTFTCTPTALGAGSFQYNRLCDGVVIDSATASFTAVDGCLAAGVMPITSFDFCENTTRILTAIPTGSSPFTYVWDKDGVVIVGANTAQLTITEAGTYTVFVSNPCSITPAQTTVVANTINCTPIPVLTSFDLCKKKCDYQRKLTGTADFDGLAFLYKVGTTSPIVGVGQIVGGVFEIGSSSILPNEKYYVTGVRGDNLTGGTIQLDANNTCEKNCVLVGTFCGTVSGINSGAVSLYKTPYVAGQTADAIGVITNGVWCIKSPNIITSQEYVLISTKIN